MGLTNEVSKGMVIDYKGDPHLILEKEFYKPGKGGAFNRTRLRNLRNGSVQNVTFKSDEKVDELTIERRTMNYLYADGSSAIFMDPESYEQVQVNMDMISGGTDFLHTDGHYVFMFYNGEVINVEIPLRIDLLVADTTEAVKGNTATNATKEAILETGCKVQVPLFIKVGDKVSVNTDSHSYVSKA